MPFTKSFPNFITRKIVERIRNHEYLKVYALVKESVVCSVRAKITRIEENREDKEVKIYFKTPELTFYGDKIDGVEIRTTIDKNEDNNVFDEWFVVMYQTRDEEVTIEEKEHYITFS